MATKLTRIAVTGGPCACKSTVLGLAAKHFGDQIVVAPEVASILLDNGFPKPGRDLEYSEQWLYAFQNSVLPVQRQMEDQYLQVALGRMSRLVLFDRGMLDGAAYLGRGVDYFADHFGLDLAEVYARYDMVIHLESVAVSDPKLYEQLKATNPARYETAAQAAERDAQIQEVWAGHPNRTVIPGNLGVKGITNRVLGILGKYVSAEIEIKYKLPAIPQIELPPGVAVKQAYIQDTGIRVRQMGDQHYLTIKGEGESAYSRPECERLIDSWAFDLLYANRKGNPVEKTRYFIPYLGFTLELDVYHGHLTGLITLECEFRSVDQVQDFVLPVWARTAVDVSADKQYTNHSLALNGLP